MKNLSLREPTFKLKTYLDSQTCFNISYSIYIFLNILNYSFYKQYLSMKIITLMCAALLVYGELLTHRYTLKEAVFLILSVMLSLLLYIRSGFTLLLHFIFIFCNRNIRFDKTAKLTVWISLAAVSAVILSACAGIIPNYIDIKYMEGNAVRKREYLGFLYSLYPSMILYNITSVDLYVHRKNPSGFRCLFWLILNTLMYTKTDSRLSYGLSLLVIATFWCIDKWPFILEKLRFIFKLLIGSFVIAPIISFGFILSYSTANAFLVKLNATLEGRLRLGKEALQQYGIKLFGQNIRFVGNGLNSDGKMATGIYNYVDCFYENILLQYGLLFLILIIVFFTMCLYIAYKKRDYHIMILLTILAGHGIIDNLILYVFNNTLWFLVSIYIYSSINTDTIREKLNQILRFDSFFQPRNERKL